MRDTELAPRIGAWELSAGADAYERGPGEWHHWADVPGFPARAEVPRVLIFGESAARGLFYDPALTFADLVRRRLGPSGPATVEVLDLARTGARVTDILGTARAARALRPDAVVLFAGNNWKYALSEPVPPELREREASAMARSGVRGVLEQREAALREVCSQAVHEFCATFEGVAPVVVVIPESNLLDWSGEPLTPVLGDGRELRWHALRNDLRTAVGREDWTQVLTLADELEVLDEGVSDETHRNRGRAYQELGLPAEAIGAYRRARDVRLWYDTIDPSWLPSSGVQAMSEAAADHGAGLVDLPEILPRHATSGIPDRSLFLDFCHLNLRGLSVVAEEVVKALAAVAGLPGGDPTAPPPDAQAAEVESGAQLCAAMVHADFSQPLEAVAFHARAAVENDPRIATAMRAYCAAPGGDVPWWARPRDLSTLPNVTRFILGTRLTGRYRLDDVLFEAFTAQIENGTGPRSTTPRPDRSLSPGVRTSLLDPRFAPGWSPPGWEGLLGTAEMLRRYYRSYTDLSRFHFSLAGPDRLHLDLVVRSGTPGPGRAHAFLDGVPVGSLSLTDGWQRWQLRVEADVATAGAHRLDIRWERTELRTAAPVVIARRMRAGMTHELFTVWGEVFSLHATPGSDEHVGPSPGP